MAHPAHRLIEMHLQYGDVLTARSSGGKEAPCEPHPTLPNLYTTDTSKLTPGEPFRYVVRRDGEPAKSERFFAHDLALGGVLDIWEGVRAIDNAFYVSEVREQFDRRGFAVVPGVLSADVVRDLGAVLRPLMSAAWGESDGEGGNGRGAGKGRGAKSGAAFRDKINLEKVLLGFPYLLQAMAEKLGPLLRALVGDHVFLEYEQVMVVRAKTSYVTLRHRDVDGGKEGFSKASKRHDASVHLWIPLVDIDETRACMYVEPFDAPERPIEMKMRAGDALFLHNYVWHGSNANTSPEHRISWLVNFAPAPSRDESNPHADLNLPMLLGGVPADVGPEVCRRLVQDKPTFLNLFDGFFTYDPQNTRMVHPENRAAGVEPSAP